MLSASSVNGAAPLTTSTSLPQRHHRLAIGLLTLVLGFNSLTTFLAPWQGQPGFTAQMSPAWVFYDLSVKVEPWQFQPYPGQPAPPRGGQP